MRQSKIADKIREQADELALKIDELETRLDHAGDNARLDKERALKDLRAQKRDLANRATRLREAGDDAWQELAEGAEKALAEFSKGFERAKAMF